jgi:hypothetical protein
MCGGAFPVSSARLLEKWQPGATAKVAFGAPQPHLQGSWGSRRAGGQKVIKPPSGPPGKAAWLWAACAKPVFELGTRYWGCRVTEKVTGFYNYSRDSCGQ